MANGGIGQKKTGSYILDLKSAGRRVLSGQNAKPDYAISQGF
jgi:hypothetical protein